MCGTLHKQTLCTLVLVWVFVCETQQQQQTRFMGATISTFLTTAKPASHQLSHINFFKKIRVYWKKDLRIIKYVHKSNFMITNLSFNSIIRFVNNMWVSVTKLMRKNKWR